MVVASFLRVPGQAMRSIVLQSSRPALKAGGNVNALRLRCTGNTLTAGIYWFSTSAIQRHAEALDRTRNIGIIAHIDAGKTTTTERMLYYGGFTRRIGDVDEGSTVTDFLPAERARGITIQSAAITFHWPPKPPTEDNAPSLQELQDKSLPRSTVSHTINLIDTPGHADFTFEVMRSLRILDGAVCILDGVAGVEAQTEQVWHQASTYRIPRVVYVNKLDRDGAAFGRTVREVGSRLGGWPAVCQIPWFKIDGGNHYFLGVADAINLCGLRWEEGGDGKSVKMFNIQQLEMEDGKFAEELKRARAALVELLSEHDEAMVEKFLECEEDHLQVAPIDILNSLRRCLLNPGNMVIPVFAGASFRNIGVQPLLDAVLNLLPSPVEAHEPEVTVGGVKGGLQRLLSGDLIAEQSEQTAPTKGKQKKAAPKSESRGLVEKLDSCSLAFKVVNDAKRGILVYVRVYSGSLDRNSAIFNTNLGVMERAPRLLKMYANDAVEVNSIPAGHIGVITGLKHARTGDTLVSYAGNRSPPEPLNTLQLRPIHVPPPVFFASVEPHSLGEAKRVEESLALLLREDPSLHVAIDEDSGQTLLSGMGELHLEIARDRLINDLKAKAYMGRIEIGYREAPLGPSNPVTKIYDKEVAGRKGKAGCTATLEPFDPETSTPVPDNALHVSTHEGNQIVILTPNLQIGTDKKGIEYSPLLPSDIDVATFRTALSNGCLAALARGPQFLFPMHSTRVTLTIDPETHLFGPDTTPSALSAAARLAVTTASKELLSPSGPGTSLMEPVMNVIISVDENSFGLVSRDITSARSGEIISMDEDIPLPTTDLSSSPQPPEELPTIDPAKIYAPPDPFETPSIGVSIPSSVNRPRTITAKVPLKDMVGYLKHLRSLTKGRGTFVMSVDRFRTMAPQKQKAVLEELRGMF